MGTSIHTTGYSDLFGTEKRPRPLTLQVSSKTKVLILSDCHLHEFNQVQYSHLVKTISSCDQLIVNGDFWFDKKTTFDSFVNSKWQKLFPLMKEKNTIYLFGNHDMPKLSDARINLFSEAAGFELKLMAGKLSFHIEHGHLLSTGVVKAVLTLFENHPRLLGMVTAPLGVISDRVLGTMDVKPAFVRKINREYKQKRLTVSRLTDYFVMGHTHVAEFDEQNKYINLGRTHHGEFSYVTIYNNAVDLVIL
jgi:predicted phosphodiesterase